MSSDTDSCAEQMRFTARCAFEILGVTMASHANADEKASAADASQDRMINSLVAALEPEQEEMLRQRREHISGEKTPE